ncbi:MAG TPA: outer membrane lipoprotein-sorting protein, partial [Flavobacteriaceae bacterium]|nr:outer membrane lipoprotein-sorting protein [Flavobacteriaceae bacterium]
ELTDIYEATIISEETIGDRNTWKLELIAKVDDVSYPKRTIWIDTERFVPLKEELFAKSGQLLKKVVMDDIKQVEGRWYPFKMNYKDVLKDGKGTDFIVKEIQFNVEIPEYIFTKASLKK